MSHRKSYKLVGHLCRPVRIDRLEKSRARVRRTRPLFAQLLPCFRLTPKLTWPTVRTNRNIYCYLLRNDDQLLSSSRSVSHRQQKILVSAARYFMLRNMIVKNLLPNLMVLNGYWGSWLYIETSSSSLIFLQSPKCGIRVWSPTKTSSDYFFFPSSKFRSIKMGDHSSSGKDEDVFLGTQVYHLAVYFFF